MEDLDIFSNLPNTLKNIIIRKSATCESATDNGKKCMKKFKYTVNDYMFSAQELKKEMMDCSNFCLKHILELILKGELLVGYQTDKNKKRIKRVLSTGNVSYKLDGGAKEYKDIDLLFTQYSDGTRTFIFNKRYIPDESQFKKEMIGRDGYPKKLVSGKNEYSVNFLENEIPSFWKIFIIKCFETMEFVNLEIDGWFIIPSIEGYLLNMTLALGNMNIGKHNEFTQNEDYSYGKSRIEFKSFITIKHGDK